MKAHPNAPKRLISLWRKLGSSDRAVAKERHVNQFYVSQLLRRGIEPADLTEHQQDIRVKLFLHRKKRKPRAQKPEEWIGQSQVRKSIRKLHRQTTLSFKHSWNNGTKKKR